MKLFPSKSPASCSLSKFPCFSSFGLHNARFSRRKEITGTFGLSDQSRPHFVLPLDHSIGHHDIQNGEQCSGPKTALFLAPSERLRLCFGCRLWTIRYKPCYPLLPPGSMPSKVPVSYNWRFQVTSQAHKASELLS